MVVKYRFVFLLILIFTACFQVENGYTDCDFVRTNLRMEQVTEMRKSVATLVKSGNLENQLCDEFYKIPFNQFDSNQFFEIFENNKGVAKCGLTAAILTKELNNVGIEAYSYDFGFEGTSLTHVFTICKVSDEPEFWTVQDAHYNYSILDSSNQAKDFFELLLELKANKFDNIKIENDTTIRKVLVKKAALNLDSLRSDCENLFQIITSDEASEMVVLEVPICFMCHSSNSCVHMNRVEMMEKRLKNNELPMYYHYAVLLQIGEVWGPSPLEVQERISSVLSGSAAEGENTF